MKKPATKTESKKKSKGTLLAEQTRAEANKLTEREREKLTVAAMKLFYGGPVQAHAHRA